MARRWQEDVELVAQLGIGATRTDVGLDVWDTALWDSGAWSGLEPLWVDVPCTRVVSARIQGGRKNVWDSFDTGTLSLEIVDEENRYAYYPDDSGEFLELRPGSPIRLVGLFQGLRYPLFRGYVEIITERISGEAVITVRIDGQDALGQIARVDNLERAAEGANDTTTERVTRLLDSAQWPTEWRELDATTVRHQATTLAAPALDEMFLVVWTEGGAVYGDRYGQIRLRSRTWLVDDYFSVNTQRVVGNVSGVCPAEIVWSRAADSVVNDVSLARVGGTAITTRDEDSISRMGKRSWHRYDLSAVDDYPVASRAEQLLAERSEGRLTIDSIVIDGDAVEDWPFILGVDYGWRLEVHYRHPVYGWELQLPVFVQSIQQEIRPDGWQLSLGVDDVNPYDARAYWDAAKWDSELARWEP